MSNRILILFASLLAAVVLVGLLAGGGIMPSAQPVAAGGWAVVTLDALPEHIIAGEPFTINFAVRQHGITTLTGLEPQITFAPEDTGSSPAALAFAASEDLSGHYTAQITLPDPGMWTWSINAFGPEQPMPALTVVPARTTDEQIAYGAALFVAKGCVVCHTRSGVTADTYASGNQGPSLTGYTSDDVFLRNWLRDPSAVKPGTTMPTLGLNDAEIEALIAFLLAE